MGLVEKLKTEFPVQDEWVPFELHPEIPPEGVPLADFVPDVDPEDVFYQLTMKGEPFGVRFSPRDRISNSRLSLEAGEFAREKGLYHDFHAAAFKAYFADVKDIGDRTVVLEIAASVGLDVADLQQAWDNGTYTDRVIESTKAAREKGILVAPTFMVEGYGAIVGAQPERHFREVFEWLLGGREGAKPLF